MAEIKANLRPSERAALRRAAAAERRDMREQAALYIRRELERAGYLPAESPKVEMEPANASA